MDETMLATRKAEHSLLGAIILEAAGQSESGIIREVAKIVQPENFLDTTMGEHLHNRIYQAMVFIHGPMNEVTICEWMIHKGNVPPRGLRAEFGILNDACPYWLDWQSYAQAVKEFSLARKPDYKRKPVPRGGAV